MNNIKLAVILIFAIIFLPFNLFGQKEVRVEIDHSQFKYDSTSNLIEVYLFVDKSSLMPIGSTKNIGLISNINLVDTVKNAVILDKTYQFDDNYDINSPASKVILSTLHYAIPYGKYTLTVSVEDKNDTTNHKTIKDFVSVTPFPVDKISISNIQLASDIILNSDKENSLFYKNGLEVIPNPTSFYYQKPVMFYYAEIYLSNVDNIDNDRLILERTIVNEKDNIVESKSRRINSKGNDLVEVDVINISEFPTGSYSLVLTVIDSTTNTHSKSSKKFYLYNPVETDVVQYTDDSGFLSSEFTHLSENECDQEFTSLKYFLDDNEKKTYESLQIVEAKRKFLYNYWHKSDSDLTIPPSERRLKHLERVEYVNKKFGAFSQNGIDTDRGRVYIKYGPPDDIENHHNDPGAKPFEIWEYNSLEGGVIFVFGDISGYNNYELIHSTKRGEIYDQRWQQRVFEAY